MPGIPNPPSDPAGADSALRVVIVDDEELFRAGLRAMLELQGLEVIAEASRADEALEIVPRAAPDVVLISLDAPGMPAGEATRRLVDAAPRTTVVALSGTRDARDVLDVLIAGACCDLAKAESAEERAGEIVRAAAAGETVLSPATARAVVDRLRELTRAHRAADAIGATLSSRELEVLRLIAEGNGNAEIGAVLFISPQTVKHHVTAICRKLGAENRVQAAVRAIRAGLI